MILKPSGLMIVKNEEVLLPRALKSMWKVCADIFLLIDDKTTDNTVSIATYFGCKWSMGTFANWRDQRNRALQLCSENSKSDWFLFMDADEYLSDKLVRNIPRIIESTNNTPVDIIGICRANFLENEGPKGWPDVQPRLMKRHVRYSGSTIHEAPAGNRVDLLEDYDGPIGHIIHDKTLERQKMQNRQYYQFDPSRYKTCPEGCEDIWKEP